MLQSVPYFFDGTGTAIRAYLGYSEGKKAALTNDHKGMTLCEKSFDDLLFLGNDNLLGFDGLMVCLFGHQLIQAVRDVLLLLISE